MILSRRELVGTGGGFAAALACPALLRAAPPVVEIAMAGRADGSAVWFDPIGIRVEPGTTMRWVNRDPGNAHTATAYHPAIDDRQRRIPAEADAWDSDYLLPSEVFAVTLEAPGVYDYYCRPHEMAGMIGRVVVGSAAFEPEPPPAGEPPAAAALAAFPPVSLILAEGVVRPG